jgi:hypothetical protein
VIQTVYVLEILRAGGVFRGHFAQTLGAAQRAAAGKYRLSGVWVQGEDRLASQLLDEQGNELARVVMEMLEYG